MLETVFTKFLIAREQEASARALARKHELQIKYAELEMLVKGKQSDLFSVT